VNPGVEQGAEAAVVDLMERTGAHVLHNNNGSTNPVAAAHAEHRQDRAGGPPEQRLCAFGSGKPIEHPCLAWPRVRSESI